jgi:hypothetical protein
MNDSNIRPRRSFIFTPGLKPGIFPRALASGTDIVCVELEDGIAPKDKSEARINALALFETPQADDGVNRKCVFSKYAFSDGAEFLKSCLKPGGLLPEVSVRHLRNISTRASSRRSVCRTRGSIQTGSAGTSGQAQVPKTGARPGKRRYICVLTLFRTYHSPMNCHADNDNRALLRIRDLWCEIIYC